MEKIIFVSFHTEAVFKPPIGWKIKRIHTGNDVRSIVVHLVEVSDVKQENNA